MYSNTATEVSLGMKVGMFMLSIGQEITEYLVDLKLLQQKLKKHNLFLIDQAVCEKMELPTNTGMDGFEVLFNACRSRSANPYLQKITSKLLPEEKQLALSISFSFFKKHSNRVSTSAQTAGNGLPEISSPMQLGSGQRETLSVGQKPPFRTHTAQSKPTDHWRQ